MRLEGAELRLGRLFDRESGRSFIAAFDHGLTLRVSPETGRASEVLEKIIACAPESVLISPGLLKRSGKTFAFKGTPVPIFRADWAYLDERVKCLGEQYRVLCTPRDAVALGAEAVVMFCDQLAEASETYTALAEALTPVLPRLG